MTECTPSALSEAAKCFRCIPRLKAVKTYLLCQWANLPTCDPDALIFIAAAGLTDQTQIDAVCELVENLKNTGTPSFWSRQTLIYPFVGGNAAAHAVNLRNPGTNNLTFLGGGFTHSALGVQGNGSASYANTAYPLTNIWDQNIAFMWYVDLDGTTDTRSYFGTFDVTSQNQYRMRRETGATGPWDFRCQDAVVSNPWALTEAASGAQFVQRDNTTHKRAAKRDSLVWISVAQARANNWPTFNMVIWAFNFNNSPTNPPTEFSNARLSGWSMGTKFLSDAERLQYKVIWDTFEGRLGRGHP